MSKSVKFHEMNSLIAGIRVSPVSLYIDSQIIVVKTFLITYKFTPEDVLSLEIISNSIKIKHIVFDYPANILLFNKKNNNLNIEEIKKVSFMTKAQPNNVSNSEISSYSLKTWFYMLTPSLLVIVFGKVYFKINSEIFDWFILCIYSLFLYSFTNLSIIKNLITKQQKHIGKIKLYTKLLIVSLGIVCALKIMQNVATYFFV